MKCFWFCFVFLDVFRNVQLSGAVSQPQRIKVLVLGLIPRPGAFLHRGLHRLCLVSPGSSQNPLEVKSRCEHESVRLRCR